MAGLSADLNPWLYAAAALVLVGFLCCGAVLVRRRSTLMDRVVALEMAGTVTTLVLLLVSEGTRRGSFTDLALVLGLLSYGGSLLYVRVVERWLP